MQDANNKRYPTSVKQKILAGFLLGFVAILLAFGITQFAFRDMMDTVDDLTAPNEKLAMLNRVFQEITTLDQLQRAEAIKNPNKPYKAFLNQSQRTIAMIDSLRLMPWDSAQVKRIASMKGILKKRDHLFFSYLKQKSNLIDNKNLTRRIDTLSTIIEQKKVEIDTSVVTTQKRTTTTYLRDTTQETKDDDRTFIGRIFGKKKKTQAESDAPAPIQIEEELSISVDTLAIATQNKALEEVEKIVHDLETDHRTQSKKLLARELELIHANSLFITQVVGILHEVEREELNLMREKNHHATRLVNQSISRISILLLIFFLGAALLVYLIWVDISKSNYYKEQLERARDEAEELSQIKQRFLANMSHEIRTPLQSIIGFSEQIKRQQTLDREAVEAIHTSSEHLLHIVNEVLDYSRISSGHFTLAKETFGLMAVVKEVESAMRIQAERKHLTLLLDHEQSGEYDLAGDSFRLRQILYNILGNAIKFTTKGYVKLTIRTVEDGAAVKCYFEITDTGIGIRHEDLKKIFNQFEQANTTITRHFGGTGLGLTIVKSLIEAQGGTLDVKSEIGHGSTFSIMLRFEKAVAIEPIEEEPTALLPAHEFTGKVIVVDDDPMILRLCELILKKHKIDHIIYREAEKLLNAVPDPAVTHILMDIRMPHINGIELCQSLRKKYSADTYFIALTAHVFSQEKQALYDQGFDIVLSKPFREPDLLLILGITDKPVSSSDSEPEVLDLSALREMTLHDEALFQSVIQQFMEETESDLEDLEEKLKHSQKAAVREIVHKLAGRIGQVGILPLSLKLRNIEDRIVKGQELPELMRDIVIAQHEVKKLLNALRATVLEQSS